MFEDPFFGRYHSRPAVAWVLDYGDQVAMTVRSWFEDIHGFSHMLEPSMLDGMLIESKMETIVAMVGAVRRAAADAREELIDGRHDETVIDQLISDLDQSAMTFTLRWPQYRTALAAFVANAGQPKRILKKDRTRPLTNMEVAKYMGSPAAADRRRAAEYVKKRIADGLDCEQVPKSNLKVYRITDFPPENHDKIRPRG